MKEKILITGITGYFGSLLLKALLLADEYDIIALVRKDSDFSRISTILNRIRIIDSTNYNIENLFKSTRISKAIHCATCYGRKGESLSSLYESNMLFPLLLLELSIKTNVKTFVNTSTLLDKNVSGYSLTKRHFEEACYFLTRKSSLSFINIGLEQFYGPGAPESLFPSYIINSLKKNVPALDLTKGEQKRDFIFIDDVVNAYVKILGSKFECGYTNVSLGSGINISIREFVEKVKTITGSKTKLNFGAVPYRDNELMCAKVDLSILRALGWNPEVSIDSGIKKCL